MSLNFQVSPDVLIPRPDTEIMVETALSLAQAGYIQRICDVGTGSGAIAISLAVYLPEAEIYAVDLSPAALQIARENARQHHVTVDFREGDLLEPFKNEAKLDMITANLPYVTAGSSWKNWKSGSRILSLTWLCWHRGMDWISIAGCCRRLISVCDQAVMCLCEIDPRQAEAARL